MSLPIRKNSRAPAESPASASTVSTEYDGPARSISTGHATKPGCPATARLTIA